MKYIGQHIFDYVASFRQKVGIGTDTPTKNLTVEYSSSNTNINSGEGLGGGTSGNGVLIKNTNTLANSYASLDFRSNNADGRIAYKFNSINDGDFHFITDDGNSPSTKLIILNGGNVGIGTDSPNEKLHVAGDLKIQTNADAGVIHFGDTSDQTKIVAYDSSDSAPRFDFFTAGTKRFTIGNTTNTFTNNVVISGNLTVSGTTTTIDTTNLNVEDKNITINYSTGDSSSTADGAGITIQDAVDSSNDATLLWNTSNNTFNFSHGIRVPDNVKIQAGDGGDFDIFHTGSGTTIDNATGHLTIQNSADDSDIIFKSDDGSGGLETYLTIDGSARTVNFGRHAFFPDGFEARFGDAYDLTMKHNGTNSSIINNVGDLQIINNTDDGDILFKCDDGSGGTTDYVRIDGANSVVTFSKDFKAGDNVKANFGAGSDLRLYHDGSDSYVRGYNHDLIIMQDTADKDIKFKADDGSGGTTTYFKVDGSLASGSQYFTKWVDNSIVALGSAPDLFIFHDGSNSYIRQFTAHDLIIENLGDDKDIIFRSDDGR